MNEYNNETNRRPITPYKASGNLNAAIGNPTVNINDTMNVNIQSMATNNSPIANQQNISMVEESQIQNSNEKNNNPLNEQTIKNTPNIINSEQPKAETPKPNPIPANVVQNSKKEIAKDKSNSKVQKTYVSIDNKHKKKKLSLGLGHEFKIALLIIVILLVFVLFLPVISEFFNGY